MNLHSKKDFQDCMLSILEPLKPYYSEEKARLTLGVTMAHYDIGATWMEAFSRPLWGLVPFWAGGGSEPEFEEIYRKGLTAGTDEKNPEYWGECTTSGRLVAAKITSPFDESNPSISLNS